MNRVEELIQQLCPNGVEWKKLGEVCEFCRGTVITQKEAIKGDIPVISGGQTPAYFHNTANRPSNTIVVAGSGAYAGFVSFWEIPIFVSDAFTVEPHEDLYVKFVFYFLKTIQDKIFLTKKGAGVPHVHGSSIRNFEIPVPPLPIQQEIVRILDTFTELQKELTANLQTELDARKKQYAYYRDWLLSFEGVDGVEWKKMGEIGTFIRGKRFVRTDIVESGIPCIHYGDVYTFYGLSAIQTKGMLRSDLAAKMRYARKNDVVIVAAGENKDDIGIGVAWLGKEDAAVHDACFIFRSDMDPNFVSYYLRTNNYHLQIKKYVSEGKICSISADGLENIMIPIPPLPEQRRIVAILDHFETLVNDLSVGLPAELEARRKQYEYYRDKLLTFDRV